VRVSLHRVSFVPGALYWTKCLLGMMWSMPGVGGSQRSSRPTVSARRNEILVAAAEVFAEKGIVPATVRDIGQRVGILSGSLYHHFASKEEIIDEILVPVVRGQIEAYDAIAAKTDDPREILELVIGSAVEQTALDPHAARMLRNDSHHIRENPGLKPIVDEQSIVLSRWKSAVKRGITTGQFRADVDAEITTMSIADVVLGAYRFMKPIGRRSPAYVSDQLRATILDGLVQS
jgi:AcrR family transcriptional regulator